MQDTNLKFPYSHNNPKRIDVDEILSITPKDYGLTPEAIKASMFGVHVIDPSTGKEMGDSFYEFAIESAISQAEAELDIVILPRTVQEDKDFQESEFSSYMFLHTAKKPVLQVEALGMESNGNRFRSYPSDWWKVYGRAGHIQVASSPLNRVIGNNYSSQSFSVGYGYGYGGGYGLGMGNPYLNNQGWGVNANAGGNQKSYPQLIHVEYIAGMLPQARMGVSEDWEMPSILHKVILKMAVKEIFQQWGRIVVPMGVSNHSLTIDGVTETVGYTSSANNGVAKAEINQLDEDITGLMNQLRSYYGNGFISV